MAAFPCPVSARGAATVEQGQERPTWDPGRATRSRPEEEEAPSFPWWGSRSSGRADTPRACRACMAVCRAELGAGVEAGLKQCPVGSRHTAQGWDRLFSPFLQHRAVSPLLPVAVADTVSHQAQAGPPLIPGAPGRAESPGWKALLQLPCSTWSGAQTPGPGARPLVGVRVVGTTVTVLSAGAWDLLVRRRQRHHCSDVPRGSSWRWDLSLAPFLLMSTWAPGRSSPGKPAVVPAQPPPAASWGAPRWPPSWGSGYQGLAKLWWAPQTLRAKPLGREAVR